MCNYMRISRCTTWCSIFWASSYSSVPSTLSPPVGFSEKKDCKDCSSGSVGSGVMSVHSRGACPQQRVVGPARRLRGSPRFAFCHRSRRFQGHMGPSLCSPEAGRTESRRARRWRWIRFGAIEAGEACRRLPSDAWSVHGSHVSMCPSLCFLLP